MTVLAMVKEEKVIEYSGIKMRHRVEVKSSVQVALEVLLSFLTATSVYTIL
jgi:hypothetical protein